MGSHEQFKAFGVRGPTVEKVSEEDRFCVIGCVGAPGRAVLFDQETGDSAMMNILQARRWARIMNSSEERH